MEGEGKEKLKLKAVLLLSRHGYRLPLKQRDYSYYEPHWMCEKENLVYLPLGHSFSSEFYQHLISGEGKCEVGQISVMGTRRMEGVGEKLRSRYVIPSDPSSLPSSTQFLPSILNPSLLYIRSTDTSRTLNTAQSILHGLYPSEYRPAGSIIQIHSLAKHLENMYARSSCSSRYRYYTAKEMEGKEEYQKFKEETAKRLVEYAPSSNRISSNWASLINHLDCLYGSNIPLPSHITADVEKKIVDHVIEETIFDNSTNQIIAMKIGRFANDLSYFFRSSMLPSPPHPFVLFSGHDNTLAPLMCAFKILKEGRYPRMCSYLTFEIWSSTSPHHNQLVDHIPNDDQNLIANGNANGGVIEVKESEIEYEKEKHFVRILFEGTPVVNKKNGEFIEMEKVINTLQAISVTDEEYDHLCVSPLKDQSLNAS